MRIETCGRCIQVWKSILLPWNTVGIVYNEIVSMLHRSFLWHYIQSLLLGETKVSRVQCPIFNDVWNVFTARRAWHCSHVSESYVLPSAPFKNKKWLHTENSWEWKDNQCLYWMKLPNPSSVAHNHAVTTYLGIPESLIGATVTSSIHHILWCWRQRLPSKLEITLEQPLFMPRLFHNTFNFLD
jgi:hypothetical protein